MLGSVCRKASGLKEKPESEISNKDMKTPGVVSLSVTATLFTRSNEKWVGSLGIYTGAKEWLIQTRCATPAIYRNQRKPCAESERAVWENRKKNFQFVPYRKWQPHLCLVWQSFARCRLAWLHITKEIWARHKSLHWWHGDTWYVFYFFYITKHKNTFCIFVFCFFFCMYYQGDLFGNYVLADDTVWWVTAKCKRLSSVVNDGFLLNCTEVHINQRLRCWVVPAGFPL